MHYDISDYPILDAEDLRALPAVAEFCEDLPLICDENISHHDWGISGPVVLRAFHGTTHDFEAFDIHRSHHANCFGQAIYFTSSHWDCLRNYAPVSGPDLTVRLETAHERLIDQISEDPEAFDCEDTSDENIHDLAKKIARQNLVGTTERVVETLIKISNPLILSADPYAANFYLFPDLDDRREEARRNVCADRDIDPEDWEAQEEIEDEIFEAEELAMSAAYDQLQMAFLSALNDLIGRGERAPEALDIEDVLSDLTTNKFWSIIKNNETLLDLADDEGQSIRSSILTRMAYHLGFDSIILLHADKEFRMEMDLETTHVQLLDNRQDRILQINRNLRPHSLTEAA